MPASAAESGGLVPQWPDSAAVFPLLAAAENDGGEVHTHGVGPRRNQAKARVWNQSQMRTTHKKPKSPARLSKGPQAP